MEKKSIFKVEVYHCDGAKYFSVTNTFNSALNELERIVCNSQTLRLFGAYSVFIQECKFDKSGVLVSKTVKNTYSMSLFTEFDLTDDIHQFHSIAMDLIEKKNEIEATNRGKNV